MTSYLPDWERSLFVPFVPLGEPKKAPACLLHRQWQVLSREMAQKPLAEETSMLDVREVEIEFN